MSVWNLKDVPLDIRKFVLAMQGEIKSEKGISQYSLQQTIYKIVRDHPSFNKKKIG